MSDKIVVFKLVERDPNIASIEYTKRNFNTIVEQYQLMAKIKKANYDAHIDAGFTAEQALYLVAQ